MVPSLVKKCQFCKKFRDNNLRSGLSKLLKQQNEKFKSNTAISSHTNYRYLSTPEKVERLKNLHTPIVAQGRKIKALQDRLLAIVHTDRVRVDEVIHKELVQIMNANRGKLSATEESFSSVFWQQQFKAASLNSPKGMRWHPAIIRWCLYLHHKSSQCYSTLRNSGVLRMFTIRKNIMGLSAFCSIHSRVFKSFRQAAPRCNIRTGIPAFGKVCDIGFR